MVFAMLSFFYQDTSLLIFHASLIQGAHNFFMMDDKALAQLINRYLSEDLSREEAERLLDSLSRGDAQEQWEAALTALLQNREAHGLSDPARMQAAFKSITQRKPARMIRLWHAA